MKKKIFIINSNKYFPKNSKWIFITMLLIMSYTYNYHNVLFMPTQGVHQWRQCDCLSITMNYFQDNNSFLEPSIHNLGSDGTGKTVSDCPIIYYLIGNIWKIFGHHEFIYRFFILTFFFTALFFIFKLFETYLQNSILSILSALLLFTSPTLVYYANNFLMDIPAFSMAIIGLYYFLKYVKSSNKKHFYLSALLYAIAGLLKISSLISFVAIGCLFFLEFIKVKLYPNRKIFKQPFIQFGVFLAVFLIQFIWYKYAHYYNNRYNSDNFLIGIIPIWDMSIVDIKSTFFAIIEHIKYSYFRLETQIIFLLAYIFIIINYKKLNRSIFLLTVITSIGLIFFALLFFLALKHHDYYTINLFILIPLLLLSFLIVLKHKHMFIYKSMIFKILLLVFLIHNIDFARRRMTDRYDPASWMNSYYCSNLKAFRTIQPYLKSLGITQTDKVISLPDKSINISLYLMNKKGWTNYTIKANEKRMQQKIQQGAKYLFVSDSTIYNEINIDPFVDKKIGQYRNIEIYRLKPKIYTRNKSKFLIPKNALF